MHGVVGARWSEEASSGSVVVLEQVGTRPTADCSWSGAWEFSSAAVCSIVVRAVVQDVLCSSGIAVCCAVGVGKLAFSSGSSSRWWPRRVSRSSNSSSSSSSHRGSGSGVLNRRRGAGNWTGDIKFCVGPRQPMAQID